LDFFSRGKVIARAHAQTHTIMICMTVGMRVMGLLMLRGVFIVRNFLRRQVRRSECQQKMKHRTIKRSDLITCIRIIIFLTLN